MQTATSALAYFEAPTFADGAREMNMPAPHIRPGVVVHHSAATVDGLLEQFAVTLKARGFAVVGYTQRSAKGCNGSGHGCENNREYLDLATNRTISVERTAARSYLQQAMRQKADLLVVSRFAGYLADADAPANPGTNSLPLLTSIAGQCIQKWFDYAHYQGSMLTPDLKALWAWWGTEQLYRDLALGVPADDVLRIVCGNRWIMVEGPHGTGLAHLPCSPKTILPMLPDLAKKSLAELALLAGAWDPPKLAIGLAAINAHYNRYDLAGLSGNGAKTFRTESKKIVVIGAFPGIKSILPGASVIEADPRPGEYPTIAMDALLSGCSGAIVSASTLINRSLPRILTLAQGRPLGLIGAATPLSPRLWDYGPNLLGGFIVRSPSALAQAIRAGARANDFGEFGRYVHLRAPRAS